MSMVAAAAIIMTSCQKEDLTTGTTTLSGETTPVSMAVSVAEVNNDVKSTISEEGGWTNYKANYNGLLSILDHRVTIQIFAEGNTTAPFTTAVVMDDPTQGEDISDCIIIPDLDLPVGQNYTAVVWVDFVKDGAADIYAASTANYSAAEYDLWYTTSNLTTVAMQGISNGLVEVTDLSQESRDAYSTTLAFTVNSDGTWTTTDADAGGDNADYINMTAIRPLSKVRVLLEDYDTREEWMTYLAQTTRSLDYTAVTVYGTPTVYNALSCASTTITDDLTFHTSWDDYGTGADVSNIMWVEEVEGQYTSSVSGNMPVVDAVYVFPATSGEDNASNRMDITMYEAGTTAFSATEAAATAAGTIENSEWEVISVRSFAVIPVVTNKLTTVIGNFITSAYSFKVSIEDLFEDTYAIVDVEADGSSVTELALEERGFVIVRDEEGNVIKMYNTEPITAEEFDDVVEEIAGLAKLTPESVIDLVVGGEDLDTLDFSSIKSVGELNVKLAGSTGATITGINSEKSAIQLRNATGDIVITDNTANLNVVSDGGEYDITIDAGIAEVMFSTIPGKTLTGDLDILTSGTIDVAAAVEGDVTLDGREVDVLNSTFTGDDSVVTLKGTGDILVAETTMDVASVALVADNATITDAEIDANTLDIDALGDVAIENSTIEAATTVEGDDVTVTNTEITGDTTINASTDAIITDSTITGDTTIDAVNAIAIAASSSNTSTEIDGDLTATSASVAIKGSYSGIGIIQWGDNNVTIKGTTTIYAEAIELVATVFEGEVELNTEEGNNASQPSVTADIDDCLFNDNVKSYVNVEFATSDLASDKVFTMKGTDVATPLTLTTDDLAALGFDGHFNAEVATVDGNQTAFHIFDTSNWFGYDTSSDLLSNFIQKK